MDEVAFQAFLHEASRRGYGAGREATKMREADGSTTIVYNRGDWALHDNYFGGEPYGGREVVFLNGRPVWMAVYYGWVEDLSVDADRVYGFLRLALREAPAAFPVRGPDTFAEGPLRYQNAPEGSLLRFAGKETIHEGGRLVYTARYLGGSVDRRPGD